jgi:ABC-2 type transport system ATP-binding protein
MLKIDQATKSYDRKKLALDHVSLAILPGDIYGFVGHNGAGKTTLLKAIAGIHRLDQGSIILNGLDIHTSTIAYKKQIAYVPDHPDLYEQLTGRQFIDFIADVYQVPLPERNHLITVYGEQFEMLPHLKNPISTYSHGMKQKTALMAALVHQPKLLLLDEPFIGLDPRSSFALKTTFKNLTQQGTMIFFSSHVLEVVEKLTNKIAIIKSGTLIASGDTKDILKDSNLETLFLELT